FRHLEQSFARHALARDVALDLIELLLRGRVIVAHALNTAEDLREIDRLDRYAVGLEQFFTIPDCIERSRPGANCADPQSQHPANHAAYAGETVQITAEEIRIG